MRLIHAAASPFARKVRVLAAEAGLTPQIQLIDTAVLPIALNERVNALNPLGKVPVLEIDKGEVLFDSRVICEYLDSLHDQPRLIPSEPAARWRALRIAALADGLMDAALLVRYERAVRPAEYQWSEWVEGQMSKVYRALAALESNADELSKMPSIAHISVACALGYLDFRFSEIGWRDNHPELARFQESFAARESMRATIPG
ncbi:glutathione S-transferase N-terminal domain-containing protein [Pseudomonas sp. D2-3]|uniref:glutathione S-transferase N-terminal domain-containing protein n=1 Tax=Phytopseudomonas argentinensis TaxID=289370 RepID=UPI0008A9A56C|nr:glutathione S-transferase N-terminal domain-containing protein [Pseudomonas argentinensis]